MDTRIAQEIITDNDRYPTLSEHGRQMLQFLREHPHAPIFRNQSGNRLTADDVAAVRSTEGEVLAAPVGWRPGEQPVWIEEFVERCFADVPFYRRDGSAPRQLDELPTISRADLSRDIAQFVPDHAPIHRLINFQTTGTTGHPLLLASHPQVAANYLAYHKRALRRFGIELRHGRGQVGVVLLGFQRTCFTYVSVTPTMDDSGLAKVNLHPNDWRAPSDRAMYLDALAAEIYAGDPISFAELVQLPLRTQPRALLSTSMALSTGLRKQLEERFRCPVLDLYSLNEAGPIAVADPSAGGHVLLQPRMFVEILDANGRPQPAGQRGEITLTGGFNFCLPLLRYRTGDHAALHLGGLEPVLLELEGRPPVRFRTLRGEYLNNIEITHALRRFALAQHALHQAADGSLTFRFTGASHQRDHLAKVLLDLFGPGQPLQLEENPPFADKLVQYTSDLPDAQP